MLAMSSVRDCGNGKGRASVLAISSLPETPVPGEDVTLSVLYDLPEPAVTGGKATYKFWFNGISFPSTVEDLCTQTQCPKEVGFNNETSVSPFPAGISGKIVSSISWTDQTDELVWCVETTWRV